MIHHFIEQINDSYLTSACNNLNSMLHSMYRMGHVLQEITPFTEFIRQLYKFLEVAKSQKVKDLLSPLK